MRTIAVPAILFLLAACSHTTVVRTNPTVVTESRGRGEGPSTAATLGVPPGHLPPPGRCRIWLPGTPPGKQPKARSCSGIMRAAPAGSMVLYRPGRDRKHVRVSYIHRQHSGVVVRIVLFEASTGKFVREENVRERER